jgi:hypothetical protein
MWSVKGNRMDFLMADTFTDSLARLSGEEQKAVKTTAFELQMNPTSPGLSFHKLAKKEKGVSPSYCRIQLDSLRSCLFRRVRRQDSASNIRVPFTMR